MTEREHIENDLIDQLKSRGVFGSHFYDLIQQYMRFWDTDKELTSLIHVEGPMVMSSSGYRMNPAIKARNENSTQMLRIIAQLDIKVTNKSDGDGDGQEDI